MNKKCIIFLLAAFFGFQLKAQELPFIHFTPEREVNPLPSAMVANLFQDREAFIWMSVYSSGLIRFDGNRMDLYDQKDGLKNLGVWEIAEDGQGYLWVTSDAGIVVTKRPLSHYRNGKRIEFTSVFDEVSLFSEAVTLNRMAVDQQGSIWIGTVNNGLIKYQIDSNGHLTSQNFDTNINGTKNATVSTLLPKSDGAIIAALNGGILVKISSDKKEIIYTSSYDDKDQNLVSLYEDVNGKIWAYKQNGEILLFNLNYKNPILITKGAQSNNAGITSLSDGVIWASSGEAGITKIDQNTGSVIGSYTRANGLLSNNVFDILKDREGNIWIAQSGGVSKLRYNYKAFENYSARSIAGRKPVLPSPKINSIFVSEQYNAPCRFWAGTEGGAACVNKQGISQYLTQEDGLTGDWVNGIETDENGRIWIATTQGLNAIVFDEGQITDNAFNIRNVKIFDKEAILFSIKESPPFIAAENLSTYDKNLKDYTSSIWFPGLRSLYAVIDSRIYKFDSRLGLPAVIYKSVAFDENGHLWVGTIDKGIYRSTKPIDRQVLEELNEKGELPLFKQYWSEQNGAPTNHIEKLFWHEDKMWIGTQKGLFALNPKTSEIVHHLNRETGLPANNTISFAASPKSGNFWVGSNGGLSEIDPAKGQVLKTLTRSNGLISNEVWLYGSVKVNNEGKVFYGTANGLTVYNPELDGPNTIPPKLALISADISYQSEGRNEVNFEYAALSFANHSDVLYQTRLRGYEQNWSSQTTERKLRYTNLPAYLWPKSYTLEVTAINESGISAEEPLHYTFSVIPVWWLSWWAFLIYAIVLALVILLVDRFQRKRLLDRERQASRIREAELQAETAIAQSKAAEAQSNALKAENAKKALELEKAHELEKAYHELKGAQNQLIQAEKMASLGRLATGIAHEIKNPLNFINNFAELSVELMDELVKATAANDEEEVAFLMESLKHNSIKIEEHGKRADSIVRSMMQHARGGKKDYEMFDLNQLIEKYSDLAYHGKRAQKAGFHAKIEKSLDPDIGKIKLVGQDVGQVLLNIIGNSLDAVWEKKSKSGEDYEPKLKIKTHKNEKNIEIKISDNGPGIPEEIQEKIFEPFFTTKPTGEGTGLGLSLSYDIITQGHNGKLHLESKPGEGANFIIFLPLQ